VQGSISCVVPLAVIDAAGQAGAATEPLFRAVGLTVDNRPSAEVHVSVDQYVELWDLVVEAVARPSFALVVASKLALEDNEVFGFLAISCATLGEAFARTAKYRALYNTGARWELQVDADAAVRLIYYPWTTAKRSAGYRAAVELSVADMASAARKLAATAIVPIAVKLAHGAPVGAKSYRDAFGVEPTFDALLDEIVYPGGTLDVAVKSSNSRLRDYFDAQCKVLVERVVTESPLANRARVELIATMNGGDVSMDAIAKRIGMSGRSLHRKLADEGTKFVDRRRARGVREALSRTRHGHCERGRVPDGVPESDGVLPRIQTVDRANAKGISSRVGALRSRHSTIPSTISHTGRSTLLRSAIGSTTLVSCRCADTVTMKPITREPVPSHRRPTPRNAIPIAVNQAASIISPMYSPKMLPRYVFVPSKIAA
jgi:Arabinose-binding domain of AraC transcription regulator, N-term